MMKYLYIAMSLAAGLVLTQNVKASDLTVSGGEVTLSVEGIPGAKPLEFTPSTNVNMAGETDATGFQINAYHTSALGKAAGQAYAMTADSNTMWFFAIEDEANDTNIALSGTNSGVFTGKYTKM